MKAELAERARAEGFVGFGVCRADALGPGGGETAARLRRFLAEGAHGDMDWMEARAAWRGDPKTLWPEARSIVMLAESYAPAENPLHLLEMPERASVSVYARGPDYHDKVKGKLKRLARWAAERTGQPVKVFVDTAPVMEKPLAQAAGLGWQGKHTNLLGREIGNWVFLGAIFLAAELPPDAAETEHCGSCRRCLDICPTNAFPAPFRLDARRCISYLTIELKGPIPREMRPLIGNRIYGCDDCLAVCPWNKFAVEAGTLYQSRVELNRPRLADFAALDDAAFREVFRGSPIKRIGRGRFLRNVMVAVGNSGLAEMIPVAEARLDDPEPLVRGHAVWALSRLSPARLRARAEGRAPDPDPFVAQEWRAALA
ncbi:tRNA epoxyqueuosine(34) reductase QueG [Albimonas pacifica]|uniref:tRNA epoxyqueuosine(34) reductase QueG n=1 Tax=Albimonas pacifica TaxID=1114924 RepID=UPI001C432E2F|nr:tRNA epoxyqueuosine(34) reductase QueG [Albimonas pacifica]